MLHETSKIRGQSADAGCPLFVETHTAQRDAVLGNLASLLTERQRQALSLAAQGHTDYGIALALNCSRRTVKAHLQGARDRLGALNTTHAVAIALARQIIKLDTVTVH